MILLKRANSIPSTCSATASRFPSPAWKTAIPRRSTSSKSIRSKPAPALAMNFREGALSKTQHQQPFYYVSSNLRKVQPAQESQFFLKKVHNQIPIHWLSTCQSKTGASHLRSEFSWKCNLCNFRGNLRKIRELNFPTTPIEINYYVRRATQTGHRNNAGGLQWHWT